MLNHSGSFPKGVIPGCNTKTLRPRDQFEFYPAVGQGLKIMPRWPFAPERTRKLSDLCFETLSYEANVGEKAIRSKGRSWPEGRTFSAITWACLSSSSCTRRLLFRKLADRGFYLEGSHLGSPRMFSDPSPPCLTARHVMNVWAGVGTEARHI